MPAHRSADLVAIDACFANAEELLAGAGVLLENGSPPRLAYHLALLSVEEIGKARILEMRVVGERHGREMPTSIARALDDHVRKLFWAIWGTAGQEGITPQEFQEYIVLATRLHAKRVGGLYVDRLEGGEVAVPIGTVTAEETAQLLRFVRATLELTKAHVLDDTAPEAALTEAHERTRWFFDATDDPDKSKYIFSRESLQKLKDLGSVPAWCDWLKDTFEKHEAAAKAALDEELQHQPDDTKDARPRWRYTVRIYTTSHSIR